MKLYGLIGYPLSHSFSKNYFSQKFLKEGITDCVYELFPIETIEQFPILLQEYPNLCGINVTIPYKEKVLPFLHHVSEDVKEIGACNCIEIKKGELYAYNTDVIGFEKSLLPLLQTHHTKALILGTGGAAKAVVWVLKKLNIDYKFVSRNGGDAFTYEELNATVMQEHSVIINTTPLGMQPNSNTKPSLPYDAIGKQHLCYDLVYNPSKTVFLQMAETNGAVIKNGSDMLEFQAEESWRIWNEL